MPVEFSYLAAPEMTADEHWWVQRFKQHLEAVPLDVFKDVALSFRWPDQPVPADADEAVRAFWQEFESSLTIMEQLRVESVIECREWWREHNREPPAT